mmetsp:Transcript_11382/g.31067  ORF Transcript_11382/g.31067 Transcript_11382/m.31067 type:complete len:366 (-) Transcript_11382:110-1207(-)
MASPGVECSGPDDSPVCRMCLTTAEEANEELISPCCCRGSLAFVHYDCILRHYTARGKWWDLTCPTCKLQYSSGVSVRLGLSGLAQAEQAFGKTSLEAARVLASLGQAHGLAGAVDQQRDVLECALPVLEQELGPDHPEVASALAGLGFAYGALGEAPLQRELLERALAINESSFGPGSFEVASTLTVLANAFARLGDASQQLELHQRALEIYECACNPDHPGVVTALTGLGIAHGDLGNVEQERELLERALGVAARIYGPDHLQVAMVLANLGRTLAHLGEKAKAVSCLHRAWCTFARELGEADWDSQLAAQTLESLAAPQRARGGGSLPRATWAQSRPQATPAAAVACALGEHTLGTHVCGGG